MVIKKVVKINFGGPRVPPEPPSDRNLQISVHVCPPGQISVHVCPPWQISIHVCPPGQISFVRPVFFIKK